MKYINVGAMWYPVTVLGYGQRLCVWFQGCDRRCPGCISPEYNDKTIKHWHTAEEILDLLPEQAVVDGLTVSGGEPFDQAEGLRDLVSAFLACYTRDILVFSGYTLTELRNKKDDAIDWILSNIAVLVDGTFMMEQNSGVGLRGSDNQEIHVFGYQERYKEAQSWTRQMQCVIQKNHLWMIGIPSGKET